MGVGMFIEIMTMTGVKGWLVVNCLALPDALIFVAIAGYNSAVWSLSSLGQRLCLVSRSCWPS